MSDLSEDKDITEESSSLNAQKPTLLLVDDDPSQLTLLSQILEKDYFLLIATSSEKALDILANKKLPDLIVLDIMMPGLSGYEFCEKLKSSERLKNIPVIFLTSRTDPMSEIQGFNMGGVDYIHKPYTALVLRSRIRAQLKTQSIINEIAFINSSLIEQLSDEIRGATGSKKITSKGEGLIKNGSVYEDIFNHSDVALLVADADGFFTDVNPAYLRMTGFGKHEVIGSNLFSVRPYLGDDFQRKLMSALSRDGKWSGEISGERKSGDSYPEFRCISTVKDDSGNCRYYIVVATDISHIRLGQEKYDFLKWHDPITGLINRSAFQNRLESALKICKKKSVFTTLIHLDINSFRKITEVIGYQNAKIILLTFVERVQNIIEEDYIFASLGNDEFLLLAENSEEDPKKASSHVFLLMQQINDDLSEPINLPGFGDLAISCTAGVVIIPDDKISEPEEAMRCADIAHSWAKNEDKPIEFYTETISEQLVNDFNIQSALQSHHLDDELVCLIQPQFNTQNQCVGFETLVRWNSPAVGFLTPDSFIPLAEACGKISTVDNWMIDQSCRLLQEMCSQGLSLRVSVNISARHFEDEDFVTDVVHIVSNYEFTRDLLIFEVTESLIINDIDSVVRKMGQLSNEGIKFSIDDFGTGYSSLAYLKRLPVEELKIDKSFIYNAPKDRKDAEIVALIAQLADLMQIRVVAEGVELKEHVDFLSASFPSMEQQGYYHGRPSDIARWQDFVS